MKSWVVYKNRLSIYGCFGVVFLVVIQWVCAHKRALFSPIRLFFAFFGVVFNPFSGKRAQFAATLIRLIPFCVTGSARLCARGCLLVRGCVISGVVFHGCSTGIFTVIRASGGVGILVLLRYIYYYLKLVGEAEEPR